MSSSSTTTITTTCNCDGKYSITGPGGHTHPPGVSLTVDLPDLLKISDKGGAAQSLALLLVGGVFLNSGESLPIDDPLRAKLIAHGRDLLGKSIGKSPAKITGA